MAQTILIVDDDPTQRRLLEAGIGKQGYNTVTAEGGAQAIERLTGEQKVPVDLMLLDLVMPEVDGLNVLEAIRPTHPSLPVIVLTAHGGVDTVVKAMRAGATDFMVKPASPERLKVSIDNTLKLNTLAGEVSRLTRKMANQMSFDDLIGRSGAMGKVIEMAKRGAQSNIPILIEGESGVGKEVIARAIQGSGERQGKPFVVVNCGAIPDNLVESILFGHEKGSFTGATDRHVGKFVEATGGTLFLDEIGELKLDMQVKLLRALQENEVDPVGSTKPVKIDIRLISATNRDLAKQVQEGHFREDLYYRLNVFPIHMPPLRERVDDVPLLVEHFINSIAASEGKQVRGATAETLDMLRAFHWPGNVRQLENAVFRAVVLADGELLTIADFPQVAQAMGLVSDQIEMMAPTAAATPFPAATGANPSPAVAVLDPSGGLRKIAEVENDMIRLAIDKYDGRMSEIARRLGIGRSTLYRKVRDLGIEVREEAG